MALTLHKNTSERQRVRLHRKARIKKKIARNQGLVTRFVVYRSNQYLYAQLVDDLRGHTLAQGSTAEKEFESLSSKKNLEAAKLLGRLVGQRALSQKIERVLFDRNGYDYHGRIQALADAAREAGLKF